MSLFSTVKFWSTKCGDLGENPEEEVGFFDHQCICISPIDSNECDRVLVGNHAGYLWIFEPNSSQKLSRNNSPHKEEEDLSLKFNPEDQLLEIQLANPILQILVGKLVSGSHLDFIGILHPLSFVVYNLAIKKGHTAHGDQTQLNFVYEHKLQRSSANCVIGSFGGVNKRDFICIQSLDGVLTFFEQEIFAFCAFLPDFLLPGPIVYVPRSDIFVTVGSDWNVHAYKYQELSDAGVLSNESQTVGKRLHPDWSFELSEWALDMVSLPNNSFESHIAILGEHNLYCMNDLGKLKFMKRFEFLPICFHPYLLAPENKLFIMIVSDTKTLLIYECTTLQWSAQLEFLPIAIVRGNFPGLQGSLTLLSEFGDLACSYLGTAPSQYIVPPIAKGDIDFIEAEEELQVLQTIIDSKRNINVATMSTTIAERELEIHTHFGGDPPELSIEINPKISCDEIQILVNVTLPLVAKTQAHYFSKLQEPVVCKSRIEYPKVNDFIDPVVALSVEIATSYVTSNGIPRVLTKNVFLPLRFVATICAPVKDGSVKITLNTTEPVVPLSQLFPEFSGESVLSLSNNAIGFICTHNPKSAVTILAAKSSQRYRLQSDSIVFLHYLTQDLILRLKRHFGKNKDFMITQSSALPIAALLEEVDQHFQCRERLKTIQTESSQYATQYRLIEKRLMAKLKERTPTDLTNLHMLLEDTNTRLTKALDQLIHQQKQLINAQCRLASGLNLILLLIQLSGVPNSILIELKSALNPNVVENNEQGWEDIVDIACNQLLRTTFAKSDKDQLRTPMESLKELKDITKLKKHLQLIMERVQKNMQFSVEVEEDIVEEPKREEEVEIKTVIPIGSLLAEVKPEIRQKRAPILLQARKEKQNDETNELF